MNAETCRSCPARVIWCVTTSGRAMPVDAEPVIGGNLQLVPQDVGNPVALIVPAASRGKHDGALYVSHFKSCPNAAAWRKRGRS